MSAFDWRNQPAMPQWGEDAPKKGRPRIYDDEERRQRHREAALRWYRKSKAAPCYFTEQGKADREALR